MNIKCSGCGYEGTRAEFKDVGTSAPCCAFMIARQCPKCGEINWTNTIEERDQDEDRLRQLCQEIKEALDASDLAKAYELRTQAVQLNEDLELREEAIFLAKAGRELRKRGYSPMIQVEAAATVGSSNPSPEVKSTGNSVKEVKEKEGKRKEFFIPPPSC